MKDATFHFPGFSSPNGTIVPDDVFDVLAPNLTEAELRVLLYIVRRTFGFKKTRDDISLRQMAEGIRTKDGQVLDNGAGVAKSAVVRGVKGLVSKGVITANRNRSPEKGDSATTYTLRFTEVSEFSRRTRGGSPKGHGGVLEKNTQQTVEQQTEIQTSNIRKAEPAGKRGEQVSVSRQAPSTSGQPRSVSPVRRHWDAAGREHQKANARNGFARAGDVLERRLVQHPHATAEDREVIASYVEEIAREFDDRAPLKSSGTRAFNLYRASSMGRQRFIEMMFEARAVTKESSALARQGTNTLPVHAPRRKMAYWFSVLEDKLGLRYSNARQRGPV